MKKYVMLAACLGLGGMQPALAQTSAPSDCFKTQVENSSGATLRLATGQNYMVAMGEDRTEASIWQPLDNVTVCRGNGSSWDITNTSTAREQTIMAIND